jgi:hypothetical protein
MKQSANGNANSSGLTIGETAGLVIGILALLVAVFSSYRDWRSRKVSINLGYLYKMKYLQIGCRRIKEI